MEDSYRSQLPFFFFFISALMSSYIFSANNQWETPITVLDISFILPHCFEKLVMTTIEISFYPHFLFSLWCRETQRCAEPPLPTHTHTNTHTHIDIYYQHQLARNKSAADLITVLSLKTPAAAKPIYNSLFEQADELRDLMDIKSFCLIYKWIFP